MNDEELTQLIIKEIGRHSDRQAVIQKVCEVSSLNWGEADRLIANVQSQHKGKIATRQGPFLLIISIATLLLGIGLIAYNMELILAIVHRDLLAQIMGLQSGYYRLASLVTGIGMTIGGLYGAWTTLASFFPD